MKLFIVTTVAMVILCLSAISGSAELVGDQIVLNFHEWPTSNNDFLFKTSVPRDISVKSLRKIVAEMLGNKTKNPALFYNNVAMDAYKTIDDYSVPNGAIIEVWQHEN